MSQIDRYMCLASCMNWKINQTFCVLEGEQKYFKNNLNAEITTAQPTLMEEVESNVH